jgi:N-acyl-D-aspartate/D-glutamate deacylase
MAKKKTVAVERHIRVPKWMDKSIQEIADSKSYTYTEVVLDLLRQELAIMGHTMGIGREAVESGPETGPVDKLAN